jgi:hypothetical protein
MIDEVLSAFIDFIIDKYRSKEIFKRLV